MSIVQGATITGAIATSGTITGAINITAADPRLENVTVKSSNIQQVVTAGQGYDGIGIVTVEALDLQDKTVTPSAAQQVVTADNGYDGLGTVTVEAGADNLPAAFSSAGVAECTVAGETVARYAKVKKINYPSAAWVGEGAFRYNTAVEEINAQNVVGIGDHAFDHASGLKKATFGTLSTVGNNAFDNAGASTDNEIDLTVSATILGYDAFSNANLRDISLTGLETTERILFAVNARNVSIPNATTIGLGTLRSATVTGTLSLPLVETVGSRGLESLRISSVSLPACTTLADSALTSCTAASITLAAVETISSRAFDNCYNLADLYLPGAVVATLVNTDAFGRTPIASGTGTIHVPSDLEATYKAETNWITYASQIAGDLPAVNV